MRTLAVTNNSLIDLRPIQQEGNMPGNLASYSVLVTSVTEGEPLITIKPAQSLTTF